MFNTLNTLKRFIREDKAFRANNKTEITKRNSFMLIKACVFYAFVLCFYTLFTVLTAQPMALCIMYGVFDAIHLVLCVLVFASRNQLADNAGLTQIYCISLELSLLCFFALEGVYTSQSQHSLYIPIAILLVLLLFIHSVFYASAITFVYVVSFAVLSWLYKTPTAAINDLYIAVATLISANIGYVLIAQIRHSEATALKKYEMLSQIDQLTGVYNKVSILRICEEILADPNRACPFLIFDLDNFKGINDNYGHDAGDQVLKITAEKLQLDFSDGDFIGRFGGDEFIVLMADCSDMQVLEARVCRLLKSLDIFTLDGEELKMQGSAGIALRRPEDTARTLFKRADDALYQAKNDGKGRYKIVE